MINIAILGSGFGTSFRALMAHHQLLASPVFDVKLVLSNKKDAGLLEYGHALGVETICVPSKGETSLTYGNTLDEILSERDIQLLVLVGFMRILSVPFVTKWDRRIINVHPSLLPSHKGKMDMAVHQAVLDNHEKETGCSVHYVTANVDEGPLLTQLRCLVSEDETALTLRSKVQALEGRALLDAITLFGKNNE
jgi:phosphoribosylglycinamide formyltransferase-1